MRTDGFPGRRILLPGGWQILSPAMFRSICHSWLESGKEQATRYRGGSEAVRMPNGSEWITAAEAADRLGVKPWDIVRMAETNALESVLLIRTDSLDVKAQR